MTEVTPPISVTLSEACRITGLGLSSIYAAIGSGTLDSVSVGKRRLVLYASLRRWIEVGRSKPADTRKNWAPPSPSLRRAAPEAAPHRMRRRSPA